MAGFYSRAKEETQKRIAEMGPEIHQNLNEMKNQATSYVSTKAQEVGHNVMDRISASIPNGVNLSHFNPPVQGRGKKGKKGGVKEEWEEEPDPYAEYAKYDNTGEGTGDAPPEKSIWGEGDSEPKKGKKTGCLPCKANEAHGGAWKMKKKRAKSRARSRSRPKSHSKNKK